MYLEIEFYFVRHLTMSSLMGFEFWWGSQSRGVYNFSFCKSRKCGYRVSYGNTLKMPGRRRLYRVYIC